MSGPSALLGIVALRVDATGNRAAQAFGRLPNVPGTADLDSWFYGVTVRSLSTLVTPGAELAAFFAASASLHELT